MTISLIKFILLKLYIKRYFDLFEKTLIVVLNLPKSLLRSVKL